MPPALSVNWSYPSALQLPVFGGLPARVMHLPTIMEETPAPKDLGPAGVFDSPTGQAPLTESPDLLVKRAATHIQHMAFLAIDPEADQRVDRLVSRRLGVTTIPLTRKG